ncbi:hypothetical protein BKA70DRAFT_1107254, partial [Coprinopsis sp. MPI-PUGE-AT-0042]
SKEGIILVDTPGFDDSRLIADEVILEQIIDWVSTHCRAGVRCEIIFMRDQAEGDQGASKALRNLRSAFGRKMGSIHEIVTSTSGASVLSYNGTTYSRKSPDLQMFCQGHIDKALKDGLSVQDVLDELHKVRAKYPTKPVKRKPKKQSWWRRFRAMFQ